MTKDMSEILRRARACIPGACFSCKPGCPECCTSISISPEEKVRMNELLASKGYSEPPNGKGPEFCEYLDIDGKCSVYEERPVICRAFGSLRVPFLFCEYFIDEQSKTSAPSDMPVEVMDYMKDAMANGGGTNVNGAQVRNDMNPIDKAVMEGVPSMVALTKTMLDVYKAGHMSQNTCQDILQTIEKAMILHNDSLGNYFSGILVVEHR